MHGLPANFDGAFLLGRNLQLICFSANQIYLHFDNQIMITIEAAFSYERTGAETEASAIDLPVSESDLMHLLEHSVAKVSGGKDGTLTLVFDNGDHLWCFDDPHYESYHIKHGEQVIIV